MVTRYGQKGTQRSNGTSGAQSHQEGYGTMLGNSTTTLTTTRAPERRLSGLAMGGVALLLTAAVAIGLWQSAGQGERSGATTAPRSAVEVGAVGAQSRAIDPRMSEVTVYIAGSQAEAARLTETIAEGNRILDQFGRLPFNAGVVVVTSAEAEAALMRANDDVNAIRAGMGLPPVTVIDLRGR